jgi:hypothetical protein
MPRRIEKYTFQEAGKMQTLLKAGYHRLLFLA